MTAKICPESPVSPPADAFRFLLDEPAVNGVAWEDARGWHGCLDWGSDCPQLTDFCGPYAHRNDVTRELREMYVLNYREATE